MASPFFHVPKREAMALVQATKHGGCDGRGNR
ncbi:hypothetical protein SAMN05428943_1119 [Streptomyces sp. 2314.4]|nr:hypothetical protein SAMN05428943_1119 [Streptomyces sp. 2314.4]